MFKQLLAHVNKEKQQSTYLFIILISRREARQWCQEWGLLVPYKGRWKSTHHSARRKLDQEYCAITEKMGHLTILVLLALICAVLSKPVDNLEVVGKIFLYYR